MTSSAKVGARLTSTRNCFFEIGTSATFVLAIAVALRDRKLNNIAAIRSDIVATGNIGCITQLAAGCAVPVVHTVELLDWATGGPPPKALQSNKSPHLPAEIRRYRERQA